MGFIKKIFSKTTKQQEINNIKMPVHLGIIMDGNGRWAKKRGLPRSAGHNSGAKVFRKITKYCSKIGIKYLTVYAFSTENWSRPKDEVDFLMRLFEQYLKGALADFKEENIRVLFLGDRTKFSENLQNLINEVEFESKDKTLMTLNIAMNYGSRDEITVACRNLAFKVQKNEISPQQITPELISKNLYTKNQPDPDLIIRPSGEYRLSNFLLWQAAYSELIIMENVLWPDFSEKHIDKALKIYSERERRFGGV